MTKLLYGSYGHHPSGKQYVYYGDDSHRVGQNVVAPVTNWKTGKNYNTMFTIQRTSKVDSKQSENEIERLGNSGIFIKTITPGLNLSTLPGSKPFDRKTEWKKYSDYVYHKNIKSRLTGKPQNILTIEDFRKLQKLSTPKPPKVKEPTPFRFKGVTIDQVLSGKKKIKLPNYKNIGQRIGKKLTKGYMPQIKTKRVWNTDTWEYDKQVVYTPPKTAISRLLENYNPERLVDKLDLKKRLLGDR